MIRSTLCPTAACRSAGRKALAAVLILSVALALAPPPSEADPAGMRRGFVIRDDDRLYHLDLSDLYGSWSVSAGDPGETEVEFYLGHGDWIRLLRSNGFEVLDLIELRPPAGASSRYPWVTSDWARRWPSEEVWKARKRG